MTAQVHHLAKVAMRTNWLLLILKEEKLNHLQIAAHLLAEVCRLQVTEGDRMKEVEANMNRVGIQEEAAIRGRVIMIEIAEEDLHGTLGTTGEETLGAHHQEGLPKVQKLQSCLLRKQSPTKKKVLQLK